MAGLSVMECGGTTPLWIEDRVAAKSEIQNPKRRRAAALQIVATAGIIAAGSQLRIENCPLQIANFRLAVGM
jgi:hypothetical protein